MIRHVWRVLLAIGAVGLTALPVSAAAPTADCRFMLGFATLHDLAPAEVGVCLDNQAFAANGDALQHTSRGLLAWRKADNWTAFTDGYQTWLNSSSGLVKRFNDEWFEWEAYPAETHGVPVVENPMAPPSQTEVSLGPLVHVDQTMDNCGPAAIAQVLRYYGITHTQQELKGILRAGNPTGMTTWVVAPYANSIGIRALVTSGGTAGLLKGLVRSGFPVIVEQTVSAGDGQLHYRAIEGYDDGLGQFITADTLLGPRHAISYGEFDQIWSSTRHKYLMIYPPSRQRALDAALATAAHS